MLPLQFPDENAIPIHKDIGMRIDHDEVGNKSEEKLDSKVEEEVKEEESICEQAVTKMDFNEQNEVEE